MKNCILFIVIATLSSVSFAETLKLKSGNVTYKVRSSEYNKTLNKLNLTIEIKLVKNRLPNKSELKEVSSKVLKNQKKAKMLWVFFVLPKMKSGAGAYATDHRTPNPQGINIMTYMLYNTPYEKYIK